MTEKRKKHHPTKTTSMEDPRSNVLQLRGCSPSEAVRKTTSYVALNRLRILHESYANDYFVATIVTGGSTTVRAAVESYLAKRKMKFRLNRDGTSFTVDVLSGIDPKEVEDRTENEGEGDNDPGEASCKLLPQAMERRCSLDTHKSELPVRQPRPTGNRGSLRSSQGLAVVKSLMGMEEDRESMKLMLKERRKETQSPNERIAECPTSKISEEKRRRDLTRLKTQEKILSMPSSPSGRKNKNDLWRKKAIEERLDNRRQKWEGTSEEEDVKERVLRRSIRKSLSSATSEDEVRRMRSTLDLKRKEVQDIERTIELSLSSAEYTRSDGDTNAKNKRALFQGTIDEESLSSAESEEDFGRSRVFERTIDASLLSAKSEKELRRLQSKKKETQRRRGAGTEEETRRRREEFGRTREKGGLDLDEEEDEGEDDLAAAQTWWAARRQGKT